MAGTSRKALSVLLSVCLACLMTPFAAFGAEEQESGAQESTTQENNALEGGTQESGEPALTTASVKAPVSYRDYTATVADGKVTLTYEDKTVTDYVSVSDLEGSTFKSGWYVVDSDLDMINARIDGDVHLILKDGCTLTCDNNDVLGASSGLDVYGNSTLTIYGQSEGTGKLVSGAGGDYPGIQVRGELIIEGGNIEATGGDEGAGIGTLYTIPGHSTLTVLHGNITATGQKHAAGIGTTNQAGGSPLTIFNVTIYGGTVTAKGGEKAAGIGAGYKRDAGDILIYGGTVTATGGEEGAGIGSSYRNSIGTLLIAGGTVHATGGSRGAGIGSGYQSDLEGLTITGGDITAQGGTNAAGIGAGERADDKGGDAWGITISGGTIKAVGGTNDNDYGTAGIGGGAGGSLYGLTITGGDITAIGGNGTCRGCGIGGCYGKDIVISGGKVHAESSPHRGSAAIGCDYGYNGYSITISGGCVQATSHYNGAAIGCGSWAPANSESYVRITGGTVVAESNADGDSDSACTALGVGLRNGGYQGAGTVTIDADMTVFDASVTPYPVIENAGGDMVCALTGIRKVVVKREIVSQGVTSMYGERTSAQADDDVAWSEATGVTVSVSADEAARLEFQREAAKDLFGLSEFAYERYLQDPEAQISMSVTVYTAKITDAVVEADGSGSEFSLRAVLTATYSSDCGESVHTESRVLTQEDFGAVKGKMHVSIKVPEGKDVTEILHTSDDGTVVYDDFKASGGTATFDYDEETRTVSVDIEHCSHLVMMTEDATIPDTGDATPTALLVAAAGIALLAGALAALARRRVMR